MNSTELRYRRKQMGSMSRETATMPGRAFANVAKMAVPRECAMKTARGEVVFPLALELGVMCASTMEAMSFTSFIVSRGGGGLKGGANNAAWGSTGTSKGIPEAAARKWSKNGK